MTRPPSLLRGVLALLLLAASFPSITHSADGEWSHVLIHDGQHAGCSILDPVRNRMLVFGGDSRGIPHNDVMATPLTGPPDWKALPTTGAKPSPRTMSAAIYDPVRDRMIVVGGYTGAAFSSAHVWSLPLSGPNALAWSEIVPTGTPPMPGAGVTLLYDAARDRALLVSGSATTVYPYGIVAYDLWALSLSGTMAWTSIPSGSLMADGVDHEHQTIVLDAPADRLVAVANWDPFGPVRVSVLPLGGDQQWRDIATAGTRPVTGYHRRGVFDAVHRRILFFGGWNLGNALTNDVVQLSLDGTPTWQKLSVAGTAPSPRSLSEMIVDPVRDRLVLHGGGISGPEYLPNHIDAEDDTWSMNLAGAPEWKLERPNTGRLPSFMSAHTMVMDPRRDRAIVLNDLAHPLIWPLRNGGSWQMVTTTGTPPAARARAAALLDAAHDRILLVGGDSWFTPFNDLWELSLETMHWTELHPAGAMHAARSSTRECARAAVIDPVRDRLIVFNGSDLDEVALSGPMIWHTLATTGAIPSGLLSPSLTLDPNRDRLFLFGGGYEVTADPMYGPDNSPDAWSLDLGSNSWTRLASNPFYLGATQRHIAIYDPPRDRIVIYGGGYWWRYPVMALLAQSRIATYSLATNTWSSFTATNPIDRRFDSAGIYDPYHDAMFVVGGAKDNAYYDDTTPLWSDPYSLKFTTTLDAGPGPAPRALTASVFPNPARGTVTLNFTIPSAAASSVRVFDTQGRLVRSLAESAFRPGTHTLHWDTRATDGRTSPAGLYFYEVRNGSERRVERLVLLR